VVWDGQPAVQCTWVDVTERKLREEELRAHERLLQTVVDTIPHAVSVKDAQARYRLVNRAMSGLWNLPPQAFLGRTTAQMGALPPALVRGINRWDRQVLATGKPVDQMDVPVPVGAETQLYHVMRYPVRDEKGAVTGLVSVSEDVTERRRAEQELLDSEQRFRTLVEGSIQGIAVFRGHRAVFANSAFVRIAGHDRPEDILALTSFAQITHPDDLARLERFLAGAIKNEEREPAIEFRGIRKDGRTIWVNAAVTSVTWGGLPCVLVAMLDITERKLAAERLEQSEERFRNLIEGSIQGILIHRNYRPLFLNQAAVNIYGYASPDEVMDLPSLAVLNAPEQRREARRQHLNRLQGRPAPDRYELEGIRKDGTRIWLECLARLVTWDGETAVQYTIIDATERKRSEEAVRASQRLLQTMLNAIPLCIFTKDREGRIVYANRAQSEFDGLPPEKLMGLSTVQYPNRTPEQVAENLEWDRRVIQEGERVEVSACRRQDSRGRSRWLRGLRLPLRDEQGRVVGQLGMNEDISDRQEAELALRQSEERYRSLVEGSVQGILIQRGDQLLFANRPFAAMHGFASPEEVLREGSYLDLIAPEEHQRIQRLYREFRKTGHPPPGTELRGRRKDGTVFWRESIVREIIWDDGRPAIQITTHDITDRKTADQQREALLADLRKANTELRSSQRLLQTVFDTIPHALFVKDAEGRFLTVNHAQARLWGLAPEAMAGLAAEDLPGLAPEEAARASQEDRGIVESGQGMVIEEAPAPGKLGAGRWHRLIKLPLRDADGLTVGVVGLAEEITQRRQTEEALRAGQRLLQTVFDTIPVRLTLKDVAGRYILVNRAMGDHYGVPPSQFIGKVPAELSFLSPEEQRGFVEEDSQVIRTGEPLVNPELLVQMNTGREEVRQLIKMPVFDEQGHVHAVLGVVEDITERKAAERQREQLLDSLRRANDELAASQRLLRTIFDTIPHRLVVNGDDGRYLMVNRAMASRYGHSEAAFIGRTPEEIGFFTPEEQQRFTHSNRTVLSSGAPFEVPEARCTLPDGQEEIFRLLKVPVRDAGGRTVGTVGVAEDITERRRADAMREELLANLRRANDDLRDFAYIVSHDLKAPLRGISSLAEWLAEDYADRLEDEGRENLHLLRVRTRRMAALLEGILTYSRIGRLPAALVPLDCGAVVKEVIDTLGPPPHIKVAIEGPLPTILYDQAQLTQVFQNLIGNAIQHLGKPSGTVSVSCLKENGCWRFRVQDDGVGIDPRYFGRIFKIFQRLKPDREGGGTGLGLSVVKKIVENQGGTVQVESEPGSGSVFSFTVQDEVG
jgi:PAS domain S-box-containing protein